MGYPDGVEGIRMSNVDRRTYSDPRFGPLAGGPASRTKHNRDADDTQAHGGREGPGSQPPGKAEKFLHWDERGNRRKRRQLVWLQGGACARMRVQLEAGAPNLYIYKPESRTKPSRLCCERRGMLPLDAPHGRWVVGQRTGGIQIRGSGREGCGHRGGEVRPESEGSRLCRGQECSVRVCDSARDPMPIRVSRLGSAAGSSIPRPRRDSGLHSPLARFCRWGPRFGTSWKDPRGPARSRS